MVDLSEAYVLGLMSDLERAVPEQQQKLRQGKQRAAAVDAELSNLLRRLDDSKKALTEARHTTERSTLAITERNQRVANLHQEIATLKRRSDEYKTEMDRVGPGQLHRRLRRERAKLTVQTEDREAEIEDLRQEVEAERQKLTQAEETVSVERDRSRVVTVELDKLQSQLPDPYLYAKIFESVAARAHCNLYLDHRPKPWVDDVRGAIGVVVELHNELRAGKYRLDKNSELVGGRSMATAESMYAAVAIGDPKLSVQVFELATDPSLYFHQIFNVFRVWCLGMYLQKRRRELRELLRLHQFSQGLRGGYVQAFIGLLSGEQRRVATGLKDIVKHEWELWQDPALVRGMGVVNLGAVAISRLALQRGITVHVPGPTVPDSLIAGQSKTNRPARRAR